MKIQVNIRIEEVLHRELKAIAALEGRSLSDLSTQALKEYRDKHLQSIISPLQSVAPTNITLTKVA